MPANNKLAPFSDNVIFWDTEFTSLDPYKGEILSIAMVKPDGSELYLELEYDGDMDPWVKENVLPHLTGEKIPRAQALEKILQFVGSSSPYMICYVNPYDVVYLAKLETEFKKTGSIYKLTRQIDFASILFAYGIDPKKFDIDNSQDSNLLNIDVSKYRAHHALDDAKRLRDTYLKLITN